MKKIISHGLIVGLLLCGSVFLKATNPRSAFSYRGKSLSLRTASMMMGSFGFLTTGSVFILYSLDKYHMKKFKDAGDETVTFVRSVLKDAGYKQSQIDNVTILEGKRFCSGVNTIIVPINDELLLRTGHDAQDFILLWRGLIVHAMSAIQHRHLLKQYSFLATISGLASAWLGAMHQETPFQPGNYTIHKEPNPLELAAGFGGGVAYLADRSLGPLWRYQDRQSDTEIVKRIKDIEVLKAVQKHFEFLSKQELSWFQKIQVFFDEHPKDGERAEFFRRAVERLYEDRLNTYSS